MSFAALNSDLSYWQKQTQPLFENLSWNIPEQKSGHITIIGGNSQTFSTVVRTSEYALKNFPFASVNTLLPDALRGKIPTLANVELLPSTTSGSFAKSAELNQLLFASNAALIIGDLSKNSATAIAITQAIVSDRKNSERPKPIIVTRDSVDLLAAEASTWLTDPNIFLVASMSQLQKLFRAIYYPRMILLSQPLIPVIETLHKFTLSYPATILTFHQENIIVAQGGNISTTHIVDTDYSPISLWSGQLATKVLALNYYTPNQPFAATTAAILYK